MKLFRNNKHLAAQNRLAALDIVLKNRTEFLEEHTLPHDMDKVFHKTEEILRWSYSDSSNKF